MIKYLIVLIFAFLLGCSSGHQSYSSFRSSSSYGLKDVRQGENVKVLSISSGFAQVQWYKNYESWNGTNREFTRTLEVSIQGLEHLRVKNGSVEVGDDYLFLDGMLVKPEEFEVGEVITVQGQ